MLVLRCLATAIVCLTGCRAEAQEPEPRALFDGTTLEGWVGDPRFWSVVEGAIVGASTAAVPCRHTTYLTYTGGEFTDFDLRFEFRLDVGNSGVQFRSQSVGTWDMRGYQADIEGGDGPLTGSLYEQYGRQTLAQVGESVLIGPVDERTVKELEWPAATGTDPAAWRSGRILARGARIELEVDGVTTAVVVDDHRRFSRRTGKIALQLHAGPPMQIAFRNLSLIDLGGDPHAGPTLPHAIPPQWIWSGPEPEAQEEVWLRREFEVAGELGQATLWGTSDDRMEVYLNGELVVVSEDRTRNVHRNVLEYVRTGTNVIEVWAQNDARDAGFWLELRMADANGKRSRLFTDARWLVTAEPQILGGLSGAQGRPAFSFGPLGKEPFPRSEGRTEGRPASALAADEITVPEGFQVELLYSVPRARQGSWVCLAAGDGGRLYASDQSGGLYRIDPTGVPGAETRVERVDVDLGHAQGLLWAFGALYVVVNSEDRTTGLFRVRDTDGDDRLDTVELLRELDGAGEHGPHAVLAHPDGASLVVLGGNHVAPPDAVRYAALPVLEDDALLPQLPDPNGHKPGSIPSGGWVARTDPDGERWELLVTGLRNPFDLAFHAEPGFAPALITLEADMEWDVGLSWYRPTRVLHLVSGADFGWRHGSGKWPEDLPDTLPAILDAGPGSPTGVVSTEDMRLPDSYQSPVLLADWAYGRIRLLHLDPDGASYSGRLEPFLQGRPLPICDLVVSGKALYFVTGGRSLQSGLYRVEYRSASSLDPSGGMRVGFEEAAELHGLRRALEAYHGVEDDAAVGQAWPYLAHADRFLRHAARRAIESQPLERWSARALAERDPVAATQARLALARCGSKELRAPLLAALAADSWSVLDTAARVDHLRVLDRVLLHLGPATEREREVLRNRLEASYPTGVDRVDSELCALLVHLDSSSVVERTLPRFEGEADHDGIRWAFTLRHATVGWDVEARRTVLSWLGGAIDQLEGGNSFRKFLLSIRTDLIAGIPEVERGALGELVEPLAGMELSGGTTRPFVRGWTMASLLPHLDQLDDERDLDRGRALYREATCLQCHGLGGLGGSDGPDLSDAGARFSTRDLLESILWPSRTISDQYQDTEVWLRDEGVHVGTVLREDARTLTLLAREPDAGELVLEKERIELRRPTVLSRMPSGMLDTFELEEILDLLAYVLAERP